MRNKVCKDKASEILDWWAIVLKKGDVLFAQAKNEEAALLKVFGSLECYAVKYAVTSVVRCNSPVVADLTFLGK